MPGPKKGTPQIKIDLSQAEKLGELQCTYAECAAFLSTKERTISEDLLKHRQDFITAYKKGAEVGKISLRRTQFRLSKKSPAMAIWLGKQYLGQTEKQEMSFPDAERYFQAIADAIIRADTTPNSVLQRQSPLRN
ncbi:MAG TPA: hypothetical protein PLC67_11980 [Spirochaetota bacterium]|jgi:hypothetical protein|nr:hypothetical protein [Spirochaetota bacterium]